MKTTHRTIRTFALAAVAATALGVAAPATAEQVGVNDPADVAGASFNDIRHVSVDHGLHRVQVKVRFTDLRRRSEEGPASVAIFLDTRAHRKGPEFALFSGLQAGTDFQLVRMRDARPVGGPLSCRHSLDLGFATDVLTFRASRRDCLGTPARVRVGVRMTDDFDASHPITDWLGRPRSFTRWLASS